MSIPGGRRADGRKRERSRVAQTALPCQGKFPRRCPSPRLVVPAAACGVASELDTPLPLWHKPAPLPKGSRSRGVTAPATSRGARTIRVGSHMGRRLLAACALAVMAAAGGCATGPLSENPVLLRPIATGPVENPIYVPLGASHTSYRKVFEQVIDVVDDYFDIAESNMYA